MSSEHTLSNKLEQTSILTRRTIERKYSSFLDGPMDDEFNSDICAVSRLDQLLYSHWDPKICAQNVCKYLPKLDEVITASKYKDLILCNYSFASYLARLSLICTQISDPELQKQINNFFHKYTNADCSFLASAELYYDLRGIFDDADYFFAGHAQYPFPSWMKF